MLKTKLFSALVLMGTSTSVFAHAGHDHSHWTSDYLHIAFYGALIAFAIAAAFALKNIIAKSQQPKSEQEL